MAETGTATPPAIDQAAINKAVTDTLQQVLPGAIGAAIKPMQDAVSKLQPPAAGANAAQTQGEQVTLESIGKLIDTKLNASQQQQQNVQQREQFITQNLAKLPKAYQQQLGNDPTKWDAESKAIQSQFEADAKGLGVKLESLGTPAADGGKAASKETVDTSKLPAFERIHQGLPEVPGTTVKKEDVAK